MNQESSFKKDKKNLNSFFLLLNSHAFTLAEILVVMAITAIVGAILVVIFTNTLRGSNKSQILAVIKQNGQAVLENMDKTIRGADDICISSDQHTLVVIKNGEFIRYRFVPADGLIQQDKPTKQTDASGIEETTGQAINRICSSTDTMDASTGLVTLTDTNTQTGVLVECVPPDCATKPVFSKNPSAGFKDQVTIRFNLRPGAGASPVITSQIDPVTFQTTIGLR